MKYTNRADLIIAAGESIKMQEAAGIDPICKCFRVFRSVASMSFDDLSAYEFPLAVVEGKPVFVGDALYHSVHGKLTIRSVSGDSLQWLKDGRFLRGDPRCYWSWNQPKPRTVMVELLLEDAEYWASYDIDYAQLGMAPSKYKTASENFYKSVRKALETK